jgi:hypothetical protein
LWKILSVQYQQTPELVCGGRVSAAVSDVGYKYRQANVRTVKPVSLIREYRVRKKTLTSNLRILDAKHVRADFLSTRRRFWPSFVIFAPVFGTHEDVKAVELMTWLHFRVPLRLAHT